MAQIENLGSSFKPLITLRTSYDYPTFALWYPDILITIRTLKELVGPTGFNFGLGFVKFPPNGVPPVKEFHILLVSLVNIF